MALGLALQILNLQAMADLRIAAQRSGAAARHVGQNKVIRAFISQRGCIGETAFDPVAERSQSLSHLSESLRARFARHDMGLWIALGQDQRLAAWRCAAIQNRAASLARPAISATSCEPSSCSHTRPSRKAAVSCDVAGNNGAGGGQQFAGFQNDSRLGEFFFQPGAHNARHQRRLALPVRDRLRCVASSP